MKRAIVVVLDGCGVGAAPDWRAFGDEPSRNTLENVLSAGDWRVPTLTAAGLFPTREARGIDRFSIEHGRLRPCGAGKDSVTGHWEMMGALVREPFPTFPKGFPNDLIAAFEGRIGRRSLGNIAASGTEIIERLGEESARAGAPIVYTSADSVFQIAAHESAVPPEELYRWCEIAREECAGAYAVQRVIARPFAGEPGAYVRTDRRRDFPLPPPPNLCDVIGDVVGVGVVPELFTGRGFRSGPRTGDNAAHEAALIGAMEKKNARFIFANFEDFDMRYGHRNDAVGFGRCLERFDATLVRILAQLEADDLLIITADHGNDPTDSSTDHTREFVPFVRIECSPERRSISAGDRDGFVHIGRAVAEHLGVAFAFDAL